MIQTNITVLWITMQINSFCLSCSVRYMLAITVSAWAESYKNKQNTTTHPWIKLFLMLYSSFFWEVQNSFYLLSVYIAFIKIWLHQMRCIKYLLQTFTPILTGQGYGKALRQPKWLNREYTFQMHLARPTMCVMNKYSFS